MNPDEIKFPRFTPGFLKRRILAELARREESEHRDMQSRMCETCIYWEQAKGHEASAWGTCSRLKVMKAGFGHHQLFWLEARYLNRAIEEILETPRAFGCIYHNKKP